MEGSARNGVAAACAVAVLLAAGLATPPVADGACTRLNLSESGAPPQGRAVERPDHDGPYLNGTTVERFRGSTKLYFIDIKIHYPATSTGEDAPHDLSGAPYPLVLMMPYAGGDETAYDFVAPRLVSWGLILVCVGQNQADPGSGNTNDLNDLLDQLERDNATAGHPLEGMVNAGACGISGHSRGGAYSIYHGWPVGRIRAVQALAPALSRGDVDIVARLPAKPFEVQVGRLDSSFWDVSLYAYESFKAPKHALDLASTGHGGPFQWDVVISFFFRYLLGLSEYERFLHGEEAIEDAADERYFLNFTLENGTFFPPVLTLSADSLAPDEDSPVRFDLSWTGLLPLGHPRGNFTWDFTSDGYVDRRGPAESSASWSFTRQGRTNVTARFELGGLLLGTNNTLGLDVRNPPPTASAGGDINAAEDETVELSASGSDTPSDQPVLTYLWDFGDGTVATAANASHAWKRAGDYVARVTVRDDEGAEGTAALNVSVRNLPPTASAGPDVEVDMDSEAELSGSGDDTPSDRAGLRYRWDFGDGLSSEWSIEPGATHTYTEAGNLTATLLVRDGDGAEAKSTLNVTVRNLPPSCAVSAPRPGASVQKDEALELDGGGTDTPSDRNRLEYSWDLGDGNSTAWGPSARVFHVYTRGGEYTATLGVRDRAGARTASSVTFRVVNQPPTVRITAPAGGSFDEDLAVTFRAEGGDTASDRAGLAYSWDVGGRKLAGRSVEAAFTTEGVHAFTVTVTDPEGATATASGTVFISNPAPRLTASVSSQTANVSERVSFAASAEDTESDLELLVFEWDFGDGSTAGGPSVTHSYLQAGTFNVRVTVRDDEGARDSRTFSVRVEEPAPPPPPSGTGTPSPGGGYSAIVTAAAATGAIFTLVVAAAAAALLLRRRDRD